MSIRGTKLLAITGWGGVRLRSYKKISPPSLITKQNLVAVCVIPCGCGVLGDPKKILGSVVAPSLGIWVVCDPLETRFAAAFVNPAKFGRFRSDCIYAVPKILGRWLILTKIYNKTLKKSTFSLLKFYVFRTKSLRPILALVSFDTVARWPSG